MKSAAAATEAYDDIKLEEARLTDALALSSEAGWNQEADDWRLLFREGAVLGRVRRRDGALIGSAAVLPLGNRLSWIGMVLVTAAERRRGHARELMRRSLETLDATGAVASLDATPAGRDLYHSLGFEESEPLMRMARTLPSPSRGGAWDGVRRVTRADLPRLCSYDAQAFGADRTAVLHDLLRRLPESAVLAEASGRLTGFALARPGRLATQIGPLVADDGEIAARLLSASLAALSCPVIVDVFTGQRAIYRLLAGLSFSDQRPFTRMLNGAAQLPRDRTILSAGPELG